MITATISEAKTTLPNLVRRAQNGEKVVLTSGRQNIPIATIEPYVEHSDLCISWSPILDKELPDYTGEDADDL